MSRTRPVTSKARGVCRFYTTPRGCFAGDNCKFLHGEQEELTPFDKSKTCRYFAAGYCKRGTDCWFRHVIPEPVASGSAEPQVTAPPPVPEESDDDLMCSICYEKPVTFGLLGGCSHVFCIDCIKGWRENDGKEEGIVSSGNTKKCPTCRAESKFVTPSSIFYPSGHPGKALVTAQYKASMARVPCRYFQRSCATHRHCPFGKDCFYQHLNEDGTVHEFTHGVEQYSRRRPNFNRARDVMNEALPFLEEMQATMESIRASLEHDYPSGDIDASDYATAFQDMDSTGSLLQRLAEDTIATLFANFFDQPSRGENNDSNGNLERQLAVRENQHPQLASDTPTPTIEQLIFNPTPNASLDAASVEREDTAAPEDATADSVDAGTGLPPVGPGTHVIAQVAADGGDGVLVQVPEPPFLTDGRGRVVWSNNNNDSRK